MNENKPEYSPVNDGQVSGNESQNGQVSVVHLDRLVNSLVGEQRARRRWSIFFKLCWFFLALIVAVLLFQKDHATLGNNSPHIALIRIDGVIAAGSVANAKSIGWALQDAFENNASKAIVLAINSPGGSPVQASTINDTITRLKKLHPKPIYTVIGDSCTSAAYYIAASTDQIYANKASLVGSIGVLLDGFGFTRTMKALGVERRLLTAGDHKGILDPFSPMTEWDKKKIDSILREIHQQFIGAVKTGRGTRLQLDAPDLFSGAFWSGEGAEKIGLIDGFGDLEYVSREVIQQPHIVDYTFEQDITERLAQSLGATVGTAMAQALRAFSLH